MANIRDRIRSALFESNYTLNNPPEIQPEDKQVEIFDDDVGVVTFKYHKQDLDAPDKLNQLKPYFDDINVKYINVNSEFGQISMNVEFQYKDLLIELMETAGFSFDSETFGDEKRSAKHPHRGYGHVGLRVGGSGIHGNYSLPVLIGEV